MTDEQFEDMIKKIPKVMLNEDGRLCRVKCIRCGSEWASKENNDEFVCGVCINFKERWLIS
jgi:hypothetical protein